MSRTKWNRWLAHEGDAILTALHGIEEVLKRALHGLWLLVVLKIPEAWRRFIVWLHEKSIYAWRVAIRVARVAALALAWATIVFGPFAFYPVILTACWAVLTAFGSWWGAKHRHVRIAVQPEPTKEGLYV